MLPVSLLSPLAAELNITESQAGQAVSVTAAVALVASLDVTTVSQDLDRRGVLLSFTGRLAAGLLRGQPPLAVAALVPRWCRCGAGPLRWLPWDG